MAKTIKVNNETVFVHEFKNNVVYATRCTHDTANKLLTELYNKYNKVDVTNQVYGYSMIDPNRFYMEITCCN